MGPPETERKTDTRAFESLFNIARHKFDAFLDRITIYDEKWIQYDSHKLSSRWLNKYQSPQHTPMRSTH